MLEKAQNPAVFLTPTPHSPQERCWQLAGFGTKTTAALYVHLQTRRHQKPKKKKNPSKKNQPKKKNPPQQILSSNPVKISK